MGMLRKLTILMLAVMMLSILICHAADYEDTLRVGIYYGSGAVATLTAESGDGFTVGVYKEREFNPVLTTAEKKIMVGKNVGWNWNIVYSENRSIEDAEKDIQKLRDDGLDGFMVYSNGKVDVWFGSYSNESDASFSALKFNLQYTPTPLNENYFCIYDGNGKILLAVNGENIEPGIAPKDYANYDKTISIAGAAQGSYRGGFAFGAAEDGKMTVVNVLPVEKYLYGVVSREMSSSWHVEALKTQAVCARNFALRRINHHKQYGFDVCRTTCCQAYGGTSAEGENIYRAVDETSGELLVYNGEICQTVYSSSMGSETESVENVWGTPFPYLVSVENPYEDTENVYNGKWQKKLSVARATEIMKNRGSDVGQVLEITPIEYTAAGRVLKLRVRGTGGEKVFEREMCRTVFSEATYSQKYTVTKGGVSTYPKLTVTDGKNTSTNTMNSFVLSGNGTSATSAKTMYVTNGANSRKYEVTTSEGSSDEFVFTGEGWGHGVGMSQYGAKGMAEAGFKYDEILKHYYTGTELINAY